MRKRISLDGTWQFNEAAEAASGHWLPGSVPGCVQTDLMRLGQLPDPFFRLQEAAAYALEEKEWVYRRQFLFPSRAGQGEGGSGAGGYARAELVFEGLDTLATIYLNGRCLGEARNMFIPHRFDVGGCLREGENTLEVHFASATRAGQALRQAYPQPEVGDERVFLRKAQYSFGWDWGPRLVQTGIWRSVYLELSGPARLAHPFFFTRQVEGGSARVELSAEVIPAPSTVPAPAPAGGEALTVRPEQGNTAPGAQASQVDLRGLTVVAVVREAGGRAVAQVDLPVVKTADGWGVKASLTLEDIQLWYPNGMGPQPLYEVEMTLWREGPGSGTSQAPEDGRNPQAPGPGGEALDQIRFLTGIRTVKLRREKDAEGESFVFVVNGVPVFAKGADWIPADNFLPRLRAADYDAYVRLAQEAHMNMLRVWGGGVYEDPAFYEACDRRGIMVWQDFMYACAQYPDHTAWFREAAEAEAVAVIKALRNHPSLVLWCGNNENNWGFHSWWHAGDPEYMGNYIYKQMLPRLCAALDPSRPYWVSSPYGGEDPNSQREGDRHAWDVWSGWQDYGLYRRDHGRFLSEFGFQAMPAWPTVLSYTAPEDRKLFSTVAVSHNKQVEGSERLLRFLAGRLGLPRDYRSFVYLTQFNQAEAVKTAVEHWRCRKFATAGTLYWQLNDCWPVASWSCLDYYRRKKALYYYSRHFYADLLVVLEPDYAETGAGVRGAAGAGSGAEAGAGTGAGSAGRGAQIAGVRVTLVNDSLCPREGELRLACYSLSGEKRGEIRRSVAVPANAVAELGSFSAAALGLGYTPQWVPEPVGNTLVLREENGQLLQSVIFAEVRCDGQVYRNYLVFQRFRDLPLVDPGLSVQVEGRMIGVRNAAPAFGVFLEPQEPVDLSDNCLWLEPGEHEILCSGDPGPVEAFDLTKLRLDI
ncbi:MAG: glycoside hydrolase family 2 protein [Firmicutes bacterium]|nr:glycoside hydrolase family 2 protein [Bacillota bacterium]